MAHHRSFVRKIEMHPCVFIVACSDFGLRIFFILSFLSYLFYLIFFILSFLSYLFYLIFFILSFLSYLFYLIFLSYFFIILFYFILYYIIFDDCEEFSKLVSM
jgi:hypothetical protein